MGLRTAEEYLAGLRDGREVYIGGQRVADVTRHPQLSITAEHSATVFEYARQSPELFTSYFPEYEQQLSSYFVWPETADDLMRRAQLIEETTRRCRSTFNIVKAVGTDALNALRVVATQMDRERGTKVLDRVLAYHRYCSENDLSMALAQTDVKGDRSLRPSQQPNPGAYLRIVERRSDGIVVRGAKAHTTAGPVVDELVVIPTRSLRAEDMDYAVAFAIPPATKGILMICRPIGDTSLSVWDYPVSRRNIEIESLTIFDNVFVPWSRVFLAGEWEYAGALAKTFTEFHRFTGVAYKPPLADLMIGAAQLVAESNGVGTAGHIREKITRLIQYVETIRACGVAAAVRCQRVEGLAVPHPIYTNVGKHHFAAGYHEAVRLLQDIAGGLVITAPFECDYKNPVVRAEIDRYLHGNKEWPAEQRLRLFHLVRDLTASEFGGYNFIVTLHGEGSLEAQMLSAYREYDVDRCKELVRQVLA